ncbi:MAG: hypothetical protein IBJ05_11370, partial [Blastomonas sp.]|nr:hypothetical protein [Blastomonas sp.]
MNHDFQAERRAAQHCAQLTARTPRPEERTALMAAWRRDLAGILAEDLAKMLSGDRLKVSVSEPERLTGADVFERIGPVAANSLMRCGPNAELALISFDFATAMALTDRSFGGEGILPAQVPDRLPGSAALLVGEIASTMAMAVARAALGRTGIASKAEAEASAMMLVESAARLKPFDADATVLAFCVSLANPAGQEWQGLLAVAAVRMERLLPAQGPAAMTAGRSVGRRT